MSRYIDADNYKKDLIQLGFLPALVVRVLDKQPTADVVEVRHGRWDKKFSYSYNWDDFYSLTCSECGANIGETSQKEKDHKFCFNCGAKMDAERSNK